MSDLETRLSALQDQLDADPANRQLRFELADVLEALGAPEHEGHRALGWLGKRPNWSREWSVWATWWGAPSRHREEHELIPGRWFKCLKGGVCCFNDGSAASTAVHHWEDYKTRREAESAAARAWLDLTPEEQQELLESVNYELRQL